MKYVLFDGGRLGVVDGDVVYDVTDESAVCPATAGGALHDALSNDASALAHPTLAGHPSRPLADVVLECPLPSPGKVVAAPVNYLAHKAEMNAQQTVAELGIFLKATTSLIGPGDDIELPYTDAQVDQEGELGVVIGKRARHVTPEQALDHVFGYTCLLDISLRSTEDRSTRKSFDTFTPIGPHVVTADEIPDPSNLHLRCWVGDELRQDVSTGKLIFDVPLLVAYASSVMTLEPGDVIATGTPAGVGPLADGDPVALEIERVGRLEVNVKLAENAGRYADRVGAGDRQAPAVLPPST